MKRITFEIENYVDAWSSEVHDVFKVFIEGDTLVYSRDYGRSNKNIVDYISDFIKEFDVQAMQSNTYTIDLSDKRDTYSVSSSSYPVYTTDDTIK